MDSQISSSTPPSRHPVGIVGEKQKVKEQGSRRWGGVCVCVGVVVVGGGLSQRTSLSSLLAPANAKRKANEGYRYPCGVWDSAGY